MKCDILGELSALGLDFDYTENAEWVSITCPFHDDKNPSCGVHVEKGHFSCKACEAKGDFAKLHSRITGKSLNETYKYLTSIDILENPEKTLSTKHYELFHEKIYEATPLLAELHKRGVTDDLIRKYRLGADKHKITIPIFNKVGDAVNIIRYNPGAPTRKFLHFPGYGSPVRLYPIDQLKYDRILLCGGMIKAIAAAAELNKHGIGAISSTGGEQWKNWMPLTKELAKDRKWIGVCMDVDEVGLTAATQLATWASSAVNEASLIELPLDPDKYPKGDISDWIGIEGMELMPLIEAAKPYVPQTIQVISKEDPKHIKIQAASNPTLTNKRVKFRAWISAFEDKSYSLPKKVRVKCSRDQAFCGVCPVFALPMKGNECTIDIDAENVQLLAMMNSSEERMLPFYKRAFNMPACRAVAFEPVSYYKVQNMLLAQEIGEFSIEDSVTVPAVSIDCDVQLNETYELTGKMVPHPANQYTTGIMSQHEAVVDTLSEYKLESEPLRVFQPSEWTEEGITAKLESIYTELASKVTKIFKRQDLHLLMDLAWHSVLHFTVDKRVHKGWVEVLAVGDSAQGKSDTAKHLLHHYGLGQRIDCKSASVAGLLGGCSQINGQWFVSWGVIPANDRRLVILEEIKGMQEDVMSKLTDMRSSGVAEVPKIQRSRTNARTRLICLTNPKRNGCIDEYTNGVAAITDLIPNHEDIRRFDAFICMSKADIPTDIMRKIGSYVENGDGKATYTSDLCRKLVLWGWSRKANQVAFESWEHLLQKTQQLCDMFTDTVPIIDRGSMRFKLARLAIALAVRTFSHTDDPNVVLVRKCHTDYITSFLIRVYTASPFGYDRYTDRIRMNDTLRNEEEVVRQISKLNNPAAFTEQALLAERLDMQFISTVGGLPDRTEASTFIGMLEINRAVVRDKNQYRRTVAFTRLLSAHKWSEKPDFVKGDL